MNFLRTPDDRFANLPEFPYQPRYVEIDGLRIHYVEAGAGRPVLCLHGEPTWSFLYRKVMAPLASEARVVAMDFAGFGRSDKPASASAHTLDFHRRTLLEFVRILDLREITLVVHDWGGLIGLSALESMKDRVARLVILNTGLPTGEEPVAPEFFVWRAFVERTPDLPVGKVVRSGLASPAGMPREVSAAYDAPFPDVTYKAGVTTLPMMVPVQATDALVPDMKEARRFLRSWTAPALVLFSDRDPVTQGHDAMFRALIPSASREPAVTIAGAGHFLQEERGQEVASNIAAFLRR
jgi:haloalkane dehalogenase